MIRLACILLMLLPGIAVAQPTLDLDEIETVKLDEDGKAEIRVRTDRPGVLRADLFSAPDSVGAIAVTFEPEQAVEGEEAPLPVPVGAMTVEKGRHTLLVSAANAGAANIQLRLMLEPPLDLYEPNDTRDAAVKLDTPFLGLVRVSAGDEDWFRVDAPRGHLIGVHLRTRSGYTGPAIAFVDGKGEVLQETARDNWGHRGMRYFKSEGRPVYIQITDTYNWGAEDWRAYRQLAIETYEPDRSSPNVFVKLDMQEGDSSGEQIDYVGEAAGSRVSSAVEATEIAAELERAVTDERGSNWGIYILVGLAGLLAGGGFAVYRRMKTKSEPVTETAKETPPETEQEKPAGSEPQD